MPTRRSTRQNNGSLAVAYPTRPKHPRIVEKAPESTAGMRQDQQGSGATSSAINTEPRLGDEAEEPSGTRPTDASASRKRKAPACESVDNSTASAGQTSINKRSRREEMAIVEAESSVLRDNSLIDVVGAVTLLTEEVKTLAASTTQVHNAGTSMRDEMMLMRSRFGEMEEAIADMSARHGSGPSIHVHGHAEMGGEEITDRLKRLYRLCKGLHADLTKDGGISWDVKIIDENIRGIMCDIDAMGEESGCISEAVEENHRDLEVIKDEIEEMKEMMGENGLSLTVETMKTQMAEWREESQRQHKRVEKEVDNVRKTQQRLEAKLDQIIGLMSVQQDG